MTFQKSVSRDISTSLTLRPAEPQITIPNPLKQDIFVNGIELILTPEFSKKARLTILINESPVLENDESFEGYAKFPIPLGKKLKRGNSIEIFAWNDEDSSTLKSKINTSISVDLQNFDSQAVPLGRDVFNVSLSEKLNLVPYMEYENESLQTEIEMGGFRNMIVIIPSMFVSWDVLSSNYPQSLDDSLDGDDANGLSQSLLHGTFYEMILDAKELSAKELNIITKGTYNGTSGSNPLTEEKIYTSDDNVTYNLKNTRTIASAGSGPAAESSVSIASHSYRYVKITCEHTVSDPPAAVSNSITYREIYDKLKATASASFEIFDEQSNQWIELISAAEIGTIASGTNVIKQFGLSVSRETSDKISFLLPSGFGLLRVNFVISAGRLTTGMSIIKVA